MKAAPWFVDFFAPAIEETHHAKKAGELLQPSSGITAPPPPPTALEHGKYFLGGSSWLEVQNEGLLTNNPLYVMEAEKSRTWEKPNENKNEAKMSNEESYLYLNTKYLFLC